MNNTILTETRKTVEVITLNRPDVLNSFNQEMRRQLYEALDKGNEKNVRAIIITGSGRAFSAGQDLAEATDPKGPGIKNIVIDGYNPIIEKIRAVQKPVIAAVNGTAAGAGANIALACDIVVASESASFIQAFSKIGLIPDSGGTFHLPRLVGWQRASALMMTGDKVSAHEAMQMGMIYKVFKDDDFAEESMKFAERISDMPTKGLALTKALLNISVNLSLQDQLDWEAKMQVDAASSYDYQEGVKAFLEKRKPDFKGQ